MQPALDPKRHGPTRSHHWGYSAALHSRPQHQLAIAHANAHRLSQPYSDPLLRQLMLELTTAAQWSYYVSSLRARHLNWALDVHLGRATHRLFRYPATERAYYRARACNRLRAALVHFFNRLKQIEFEHSHAYLVDSSLSQPGVLAPVPSTSFVVHPLGRAASPPLATLEARPPPTALSTPICTLVYTES